MTDGKRERDGAPAEEDVGPPRPPSGGGDDEQTDGAAAADEFVGPDMPKPKKRKVGFG